MPSDDAVDDPTSELSVYHPDDPNEYGFAIPSEVRRLVKVLESHFPHRAGADLFDAFARGYGFEDGDAFDAWARERPRHEVSIRQFDFEGFYHRLHEVAPIGPMEEFQTFSHLLLNGALMRGITLAEAVEIASGPDAKFGPVRRLDASVGQAAHRLHGADGRGDIEHYVAKHGNDESGTLALLLFHIDASRDLDPDIASFLYDTIQQAFPEGSAPLEFAPWRTTAYEAYAPRILAFFDTLCRRSPTVVETSIKNGRWVCPEPAEVVPIAGGPQLVLDSTPSDLPGAFDAGRPEIDRERLIGIACMALWRSGFDDAAIQGFADEAAADPVAALTSRFESCREQPDTLRQLLGLPPSARCGL